MTTTFTATVLTRDPAEAIAKVNARLPWGFATTGRACEGIKPWLQNVEVAILGGDKNDCWVVLTSYGITPNSNLNSDWQTVIA